MSPARHKVKDSTDDRYITLDGRPCWLRAELLPLLEGGQHK
jgi:hypothetical protein